MNQILLLALFAISGCDLMDTSLNILLSKGNRPENLPTLFVVALDAFSPSYFQRARMRNLETIREKGVSTDRFIPVFPPDLFPAYYAAATGLLPEENGIVSNAFYAPELGAEFMKNRFVKNDEGWYLGTPFWTVLEQAGIKTASFFWPGSAAEINGTRPSYFQYYDADTGFSHQIEEVKSLLTLSSEKRPNLFTLVPYSLDEAGHEFGPWSQEAVRAAVDLDVKVGKLMEVVQNTGITANFLFVSFYGMEEFNPKVIFLEDYIDLNAVRVVGTFSKFLIYKKDPDHLDSVYNQLRSDEKHFTVYRKKDFPERLHCSNSPRCGDLIVLSKLPYNVRLKRGQGVGSKSLSSYRGGHGFDLTESSEMKGIFYAIGPKFRINQRLPELSSLQLKQIVLKVFGLRNSSGVAADSEIMNRIFKE